MFKSRGILIKINDWKFLSNTEPKAVEMEWLPQMRMSSRILGKLLQGGGERVEDSGREGASEGGNSGGRVWGSGHEASEEIRGLQWRTGLPQDT